MSVSLSTQVTDCDANTGAFIVSYTATLAGTYAISVKINGSNVPETIYYRGPVKATLDVLPHFIQPSLSLAAGEELVSAFGNQTTRFHVVSKDQYGNDR